MSWFRDFFRPDVRATSGGAVASIQSLADRPGTGSAASIASLFGLPAGVKAWALILREVSGGNNSSRLGDATVSATKGIPLSSSDAIILPSVNGMAYDLSQIYVYSPSGDTLSISILI